MASPRITSWEIPGSGGRPIYGDMHFPTVPPIGVLICSHGFKGYKDYGFIPKLCEQASVSGLAALRFNFSHSGMPQGDEPFARPDLFELDRWSRQISDLCLVMDRCSRDEDWTSCLPIVLYGHSRGGVTSLLTSGRSFGSDFYGRFFHAQCTIPPTALITAAAPDYACNLDDAAKEQLRAEGRLLSPSGRTGQDLYVGREWLDEIERDPELYDPILAAAHVKCPTLIIHGSGDQTVPVECAHNLHRAATPNSRLAIIEGASHTFDCPNPLPLDTPWDAVPAATRELIDLTVSFAVEQCEKARGALGGR